jgi:hypothetical protein
MNSCIKKNDCAEAHDTRAFSAWQTLLIYAAPHAQTRPRLQGVAGRLYWRRGTEGGYSARMRAES